MAGLEQIKNILRYGRKRIKNILRYGFGPGAKTRKHAANERRREARFVSERWDRSAAFVRRSYDSYDAYVAHQASKLELAFVQRRLTKTEEQDREEFSRRFSLCPELMGARVVLCLGARRGTEVQALQAPGRFAVGTDLNPGPDNPLVLPGDFHHLQFPDGSVDVVYMNCLDHVFDLGRLLSEVRRVLVPGGAFVTDVLPGYEEGWTPGEFEAFHWPRVDDLVANIVQLGGLVLRTRRDLGSRRQDAWVQLVFGKG